VYVHSGSIAPPPIKKNPPIFFKFYSAALLQKWHGSWIMSQRILRHRGVAPDRSNGNGRAVQLTTLVWSSALVKKKQGIFCCSLWIPCASHPVLVSFCSRLPSLFFFLSLFSLKSWQCFREIKSFLDRIHLYCADELPLSFLEVGWSWTCAENLSWVQQRTPYLRTHGNTGRCRALSKTCRTIASLQRCQMPRTAGRSQIKCYFFF